MKKITLLAVSLMTISFGLLHAQTNQGKVLIGVSSTLSLAGTGSNLMNIGYSSVKNKSDADGFEASDPDKMTSINLLPKIGFLVANNFAVGLDLNIAFASTKDGADNDKYSQTMLSVGPFVRYYIPTSKVLPFFELSGSFGTLKYKYDYSDNTNREDSESKSGVTSFGGGFGLAAPLGERVMLDILAGYNSLTVKDKEDNEDNDRTTIGTVGIKLGFTISLGSN